MPAGRPTNYNAEIADKICLILSTTSRSLRNISMEEDMPCQTTIYEWLAKYPEFAESYMRAREAQAHLLADEIIEIADDSGDDTRLIVKGDELVEVENTDYINRCKLRIESRKWIASKLLPKKYGDKLDVDHTTKGEKITDIDLSKVPSEVLKALLDSQKK